MEKLTSADIEMLQKGLDALEQSETKNAMVEDLVGTMLCAMTGGEEPGDREALMEKFQKDREKKFEEIESRREILSKQIILLKAKLIGMKDASKVNELISEPSVR